MLKDLFLIAYAMGKAGTLSWGGAQAMIPFLHADCVERFHWVTDDELSEMIGVANSLPGVFAVKLAAMIGYKVAGPLGLLFGAVGLCAPGVILFMTFFSAVLHYRGVPWVNSMINGLQFGAAGLIACAILQVVPSGPGRAFNRPFLMGLAVTAVVFLLLAMKVRWASPALVILGSGLLGIILAL